MLNVDRHSTEAIERICSRGKETITWFPYPALIAFGLSSVLTIFLLPGLNQRLGSQANVIDFDAERQPEGALWIAVKLIDDDLVIATPENITFRLPKKIDDISLLAPFENYLKSKIRDKIMTATLASQASEIQLTAVIAADQRLRYLHVRPIISVLANAGITDYAFETRPSSDEGKQVH